MATLNLIITTAGQAAIAQAGSLGPVVISKIAIGSGTWSVAPTPAATALNTQIKQLDPSGSETPSPGIIHITATDNSADVYNVYEMGLYTSTGVLFAIAGGTTLFLNKATGSSALFSIDLAITNVPSGSVVIGDAGFAYPPATETTQGVAEIATSAEVIAGTDDTRIVTPLKLASANFPTKAYVDGTVSKTANGYAVLPSGLIMQWGTSAVPTANYAVQTITFPIAFPTACLNVQVCGRTAYYAGGAAYENSIKVNGVPTTTSFQTYTNWSGTRAGDQFYPTWFAIGY